MGSPENARPEREALISAVHEAERRLKNIQGQLAYFTSLTIEVDTPTRDRAHVQWDLRSRFLQLESQLAQTISEVSERRYLDSGEDSFAEASDCTADATYLGHLVSKLTGETEELWSDVEKVLARLRSESPITSRISPPNRLVGRYRIEGELGRGAIGVVWLAFDEVLRKEIAVKEVRLSAMPAPERDIVRQRTLREARATAMLSHPNIVTLFDVLEVAGEMYILLELLSSRTLATLIAERGALNPSETAEIGSAVASALMTAHRAGITHRDVKPSNVLIATDARIKLADFGIARNGADTILTRTGAVLGSPPYIAPEVGLGRVVGPSADLWGLGATLYACLEGRPPYDAGDPVSTVSAVIHGDVPRPRGHGPVQDVIRGLMVKDPTLRMSLPVVRHRLRTLISDPENEVPN